MFASDRVKQLQPSTGILLANKILSERSKNQKIISMHEGEFDLPPHPTVIEATRLALAEGRTRYDQVKGLSVLRDRLCEKLYRDEKIVASPDEILVTNGSTQAIFELLQSYISPGDRVLVPCPAWPTYNQLVRLVGGVPVSYQCLDRDLDLTVIREHLETGIKLLIINSPHNPTGVVFGSSTIVGLVELVSEFGIFMLADEAYNGLVYNGVDQISPIHFTSGHGSRILTTRTFSKLYSMTGFRIGYLYAPSTVVAQCAVLHEHLTDNVCTFGQYGASAALELPVSFAHERATLLQRRAERAFDEISRFLPCVKPRGGFYLFPDVSKTFGHNWNNSTQFSQALLSEEGIATVPGSAFGSKAHLRLSVAGVAECDIPNACEKLCNFVERHS